jgi:hypothetical protein
MNRHNHPDGGYPFAAGKSKLPQIHHSRTGRVKVSTNTLRGEGLASVGSFLVIVMVAALIVFPAPRAFAVDCSSQANEGMYQADGAHRGEDVATQYTYDHNNPDNAPNGGGSVQCGRVASLIIFRAFDQQMEIGWGIVPPSSPIHDSYPCNLDSNFPQQPYLLIIKTTSSGQICRYNATTKLSQGDTHDFRVNDLNDDGNWYFREDGNSIGQATNTPNWVDGWATTNGEQHNTNTDSAYSKFFGMQYISGTGPHDWNQVGLFCDSSTTYDTYVVGLTDVHVDQGSGGTGGLICS